MTVQNIGNQPLNITALATVTTGQAASSFSLTGSGATTCTGTTSLTPGEACSLGVEFAPLASGALTGTVNITDNNLNAAPPNYALQQINLSGSGSGVVVATSTALTANPTSTVAGRTVALTATVTAGGSPVTSGTVTFYNGTTSIGTGAVNASGVVTLSLTTLPVGADSITANYGATAHFAASTSNAATVTVTAAGAGSASYTIAASPASLTIVAGQTGTTTLTFTPVGGYAGTLTLSCGNLPADSTCAFMQGGTASNTVTLSGNNQPVSVGLEIQTSVNQHGRLEGSPVAPTTPTPRSPALPAMVFWLPGGIAGLAMIGRKRKLSPKWQRWLHLGLLLVAVGVLAAGMAGCGGGSPQPPAGTSNVIITATPASGSSQDLSLSVTITH